MLIFAVGSSIDCLSHGKIWSSPILEHNYFMSTLSKQCIYVRQALGQDIDVQGVGDSVGGCTLLHRLMVP